MRFLVQVLLLALMSPMFVGCRLGHPFEDFAPLVSLEIKESSSSYAAAFVPKFEGPHILALRVQARCPRERLPVNIFARGELTLEYSDGSIECVPFERNFNNPWWLPSFPFDFRIVSFDVVGRNNTTVRRISFRVQIHGNIVDVLKCNTSCRLIARLESDK